jgi:cephalosporin-C deacetylase-like acetyl esterase
MRYRFVLLLGCILAGTSLGPVEVRAQRRVTPIHVICVREDAHYKVGETALFLVESAVTAEASYRVSEDGYKTIKEGKLKLDREKLAEVAVTLETPGFLQLRVSVGKDEAVAAAAFEPTEIEPTTEMPDDFDEFWDAQKKELAQIPIDAKLTRSPGHSDDKVDCYQVSLANVEGRRVQGWIAVPKRKGPFPAILTVPYAGVYGIQPEKRLALLGALSMNIIIHDLHVDETAEFYHKQSEGPLRDYRDRGMADRQKSYFRPAILACVRALDYLASRPDYNGKDLAITGGSQGGGLAIIAAGLDPRVTLLAASVPALCDHAGLAHDRVSGWPQWLRRAHGEEADKVLATSAYFDAVNFARQFKGKTLMSVGFLDAACPPTTVYSAFNVLPEPKVMIASPRLGHSTDPKYTQARDLFWKKYLPLLPPGGS